MQLQTVDVDPVRLTTIERVIRGEFGEMPGMRLTTAQIRRLWALTDVECVNVLQHLVADGFLAEGPDHRYCMRDESTGHRRAAVWPAPLSSH